MKHFLLSAAALIAVAAPAYAETVAIIGGKVIIGDGSAPIEGGIVLIRDGNIVAAGANVAVPAGARTIDASGKWVTPGIFAGFSRIGLAEVDAVDGTNDKSGGKSGFSAAIDIAPAIDPFRSPYRGQPHRRDNPCSGRARNRRAAYLQGRALLLIWAQIANQSAKRARSSSSIFGEDGAGNSGGSRAGNHLHFRAMLREAQAHASGNDAFDDDLLKIEDAKALRSVLSGETRLLVHVEGANDMLRLLELKRDFPGVKMVFVGASEGWRVANKLAAAGVPVIASALNDLPATFELLGATQSNIGRMKDAGVKVAIGMINDRDSHQLRYTPQYAGNLVSLQKVPGATGLTWDEAFAAISSTPAEIMGVGDRYGSLKAGKAGDVVIWDGDPLELYAAATTVLIDGVEQPLGNRQDRLRDRYRNPVEGALPKAYDR